MSILSNKSAKKMKTTPFSDFIRNASSREKKRVYSHVLNNASKRQNDVVEKAEKEFGASNDNACKLY